MKLALYLNSLDITIGINCTFKNNTAKLAGGIFLINAN